MPLNRFNSAFKTELAQRSLTPLEFHGAALGTVRIGDRHTEDALADYLRALYPVHPPDLVVPVGGPAGRFWWQHRDSVFPSAPALVGPIESRVLDGLVLGTNDSAVAFHFNALDAVENILHVLPATTNIAVVLGKSPLEQFWASQCRQAWAPLSNRVEFTWLNELPFSEMCSHAAALPERTAILYTLLFVDAAGIPHEQAKALDRLRKVANAPIFAVFEQDMGRGVVGGLLISGEDLGREAAHLAARVLNGEKAGDIPPYLLPPATPTFDWRELRRWRIDEQKLPPNSVVRFRQASAWQRYRFYILCVSGIIVAQALTILGLLLQRARRRLAEAAAHRASGRLITAQEEERARIARDLHDDLNQGLALIAVELDVASHSPPSAESAPKLEEMSQRVKALSSQVHDLSSRLHPAKLNQLGLETAARALCRELATQSGLAISFHTGEVPRAVRGDIALCAFRVLQEALRNTIRHAQATRAEVNLSAIHGILQLSVSDDGAGFELARKQTFQGLGLLSMQERARSVNGNMKIKTSPGGGTMVELSVPLNTELTETEDAA